MRRWTRVRLVLDRVVAAVGLVVAAPLLVVLAVMVRRHDGGPAFIRVQRVGRDFAPFDMWKLRTMRADETSGRATGAALTGEGDARVTPIGRRLRSRHLDELPQLLNVVRGEMLLLGPRPEAPEFVDEADGRWRRVLAVPPGIAGPTQVLVAEWEAMIVAAEGVGAYTDLVLPLKLAVDEWYLRSMTVTCDVLVVGALVGPLLPQLRRRIVEHVPSATAIWASPA